MQSLLADFVLVVHLAFAAFVVGGLGLTWIGAALGWQWVRNLRFRVIHVAAICLVAAESLLGIVCPLTAWEHWLRGTGRPDESFVAHWIRNVLYYDFPGWVFTVAYVLFALVSALTWCWIRPEPGRRKSH